MPQHEADKIGFACRACGHVTEVKDSRPVGAGETIRRRRRCTGCGVKVTTFEVVGFRSSDIDAQLAALDVVRVKIVEVLAEVDNAIATGTKLADLWDMHYRPGLPLEPRRIDE